MPTRPFTARELHDCELFAELAANLMLSDSSSGDEELIDDLIMACCAPLAKVRKQDIGPERLSIARLQREAARGGFNEDVQSSNVYSNYRFRLEDLPRVVAALDPPHAFRTRSGAVFTGEEGVLLLLRRFRSADPLLDLTYETGRSTSQLSEAVCFMVEDVHMRFAHLTDVRSLTAWQHRFQDFANAFKSTGAALDNLIGFIDGKLQPVCRPGKYQNVIYSGHKRIHGLKTQGIVLPNGIQPFPYGPINGCRHDSHVLNSSGVIQALRAACLGLGKNFVLFGDSAYPISNYLFRMFKGVMTPAEAAFNRDMSPLRVSVEWGFGKIVSLWPFLDFRKKHQVLLSPVGLYFPVANILTNMHTCLYGSIVSEKFGMDPPTVEAYMKGGPF